ncbi:succinylglutamate desuccinylase/aspartoacylase domain-containing protein [Klebsiella pneumoniae]|uniref:succinylglutamate desuccinylase/aspartoacylase domain-containing protein n=1 Tax=Klebsiella pneumoniae TaxID=573 RepID=UPI000E2D3C03|nr:succinylglutamate desuccinylase/aspartoacylase family protein [Klebsiella pneumoniae]SVW31638.1 succinylglutamate desuccinylase [Klebsiella pneumoniae]HBR3608578.1 succinylglutamate desuccinylase/aspartoacylase family protein [Klebsiella pneumoniae]HBR9965273.1 succinylglutamate desuccinylase/aspartoacylase family protein [Klebsiella pneumoniae]HCF7916045.1 succinylglutamate desuccinylase/aspartoacylase family protein [Klebsiella pneumoniae]
MEHLVNDLLHCRLQAWTFPAGIEARWLGEGILQLLPTAPWRQATILSAGVHGNETAPIELLLQLTHDLSQGRQPLTQALLIVFGNLPAIRAARRYLHNDLNRLFGGRHLAVTPGNESRRAFALEQAVQAFYRAADAAIRAWIADAPLPPRDKAPVDYFLVEESIIKREGEFTLNLAADVENFTALPAGYEIARQAEKRWVVQARAPYILFPNAGVATGQRAGLLLRAAALRLPQPA